MDKHCLRCDRTKRISAFGKDRTRSDGRYPYCKLCAREFHRRRRAACKQVDVTISVTKKRCIKCGRVRGRRQFSPASPGTTKDGLFAYCKSCNTGCVRGVYKKNPEPFKDRARIRKALKKRATVEFVSRQVVYARDKGRCYLCGKPVAYSKMHLDHEVPLSRGGAHSYANCRITCGPCNGAKADKFISEM
jgi:5-methylcytosine-specific restriction endonuclease McrA